MNRLRLFLEDHSKRARASYHWVLWVATIVFAVVFTLVSMGADSTWNFLFAAGLVWFVVLLLSFVLVPSIPLYIMNRPKRKEAAIRSIIKANKKYLKRS